MSDHVHVRLRQELAVNDDGELVEQFHCRCGEEWTKTYPVEGGRSDQ